MNPPMLPACAEPTRFLALLRSTILSGVVLSTSETILAGTTASQHTDLPRPSSQLMAAGFLSVQKLPLRLTT